MGIRASPSILKKDQITHINQEIMIMNKTLTQPPKLVSSTETSPRIALIGCGAIAEAYFLPALVRQPHVIESLVLVDQNIERARKLATIYNVKQFFADYREVFEKVNGVIIALPTHLHHPVSMEFLSRGVHVLCEKPLAESAEKAREMTDESAKTGAVLATNYSQRLWPQFAKVKELMEDRSLGEPVDIKYYVGEVFKWPTVSGFYFNSVGSGRGILRDRGAHVMDHICWWLGGKPKVIISQNDAMGGSEAVAYVRFEYNNCVGEVKLSWLSSFPCKFYVEFERGSIEGEVSYPNGVLMNVGGGLKKRVNFKYGSYAVLGDRIVANFISVVVGSKKPLVSASDVLNSISFIDECYAAVTRFDMPWYEIPEVIK
jgi:predicted dehydrogenase